MSVICFGSLKGGVGKTSLSVNVAHAFADSGCEVLLIDLDPMAHASRFFGEVLPTKGVGESPLARLFLTCDLDKKHSLSTAIVEAAIAARVPLVKPVRPHLALVPAGPELRHFLWGKGARQFREHFSRTIEELSCSYDHIIIDTPPDFNVLTRNALAAADLVLVPVDSSVMSIHGLEEIVESAAHIKGPAWAIVRTMVTRRASRMQQLSEDRLKARLALTDAAAREDSDDDEADIGDASAFISLLEKREKACPERAPRVEGAAPIYLLNSLVYRSEQQNRLSFLGRTAFDPKGHLALREQYADVAREIENILALGAENDPLLEINENFALSIGLQ